MLRLPAFSKLALPAILLLTALLWLGNRAGETTGVEYLKVIYNPATAEMDICRPDAMELERVQASMRQRHEEMVAVFNELGAEGWELVSTVTIDDLVDGPAGVNNFVTVEYVFSRKR